MRSNFNVQYRNKKTNTLARQNVLHSHLFSFDTYKRNVNAGFRAPEECPWIVNEIDNWDARLVILTKNVPN